VSSFNGNIETLKVSMQNIVNFNTVNLIQEIDSTYMISIYSNPETNSFVACFVDFNNIFCIEYLSTQNDFKTKKLPIFDSNGDACNPH
jgi:hypothetical protein